MARERSIEINPNRLLTIAAQRVQIPVLPFRVEYDADVDTLYLRFKEGLAPTHSEDDMEKGIVYDYHDKELVGIEILDASTE